MKDLSRDNIVRRTISIISIIGTRFYWKILSFLLNSYTRYGSYYFGFISFLGMRLGAVYRGISNKNRKKNDE